jgi:uncharacterized protein YegL
MQIDCKGYLIRGAHKPAIVIATKQGLLAQGKDEEELVPVGAGALNVGGSPISPAGNAGQARLNPSDPNQIYRTRVIILLDMSYSMKGGKLVLVQEKIKELSEGLDSLGINDLEFIVILFDDKIHPGCESRDQNKVIRFIQNITPHGGTDIALAINEGLSKIAQDLNNEARNILVLITDGEHENGPKQNVYIAAKKIPSFDSAAYLIGVGEKYDEVLMRNVLSDAKFGGLVHLSTSKNETLTIPNPKNKPLTIFGNLLPEFIAQVMTAPDYPIVSFDHNFSQVFNMSPSVRGVIQETYDRKLLDVLTSHGIDINGDKFFPSRCGYQNINYSVGFIDEAKLSNGKVILHVLPRGNSKQVILAQEIEIIPIEDAILDPGERDTIEKIPARARLNTILHGKDDKPLQDFLDKNRDKFGPDESRIFDDELDRRTGRARASEDDSRSAWSASDSMTSSDTIAHFGHTRIFDKPFPDPGANSQVNDYSRVTGSDPNSPSQVNDYSQLGGDSFSDDYSQSGGGSNSGSFSGDAGHSGIVRALDASEIIGDLPIIRGPNDMNAAGYGKPIPPNHFRLEVVSGNVKLTKNDFELKDRSVLIVGRNPGIQNSITIDFPSLNDKHCLVYREDNVISITSIGGAKASVNNEELTSGCRKRLSSGDIITLGDIKFRFTK